MLRLLVYIASLFLVACSQAPKNEMISVATPIQFHNDSTLVYLEDYFIKPNQINTIDTELKHYWNRTTSVIKFTENPDSSMTNIRFWVQGVSYDIPVFKSKKQKYRFSLQYLKNTEVSIRGSFNGWVSEPMSFDGNTYSKELFLGEGSHQYIFQIDGQNILDPMNLDSISNGMGAFNSILNIGEAQKEFRLETNRINENSIYISCTKPYEDLFVYADNHRLNTSIENGYIKIDLTRIPANTSCIRVWAINNSTISNDLLIPLNNGKVITNTNLLERSNKHAMQLYFMMVDRFNNGTPNNDSPVNDKAIQPKANYMGGDFIGITAKIKSG